MTAKQKRTLAIGLAGLIVVGTAGGTYAATKSSAGDERKAYLDDVAKRLKVDTKDLTDAMKAAFLDRIDAAVKAGRLTQAQADAIKKKVEASGDDVPFLGGPFLGPGGPHGPGRPGFGIERHHGGPLMGGIDAAAKFLGLTDAQLREQLMSGKSLADIAKDKGKSVDDLKSAMKDSVKKDLDDAVTAKKLTQAEADKILSEVDSRLDDIVNGKAPKLRMRKRGDRPGGPPEFRGKRGDFRGGPPGVPGFI